jgi:cell division septation protein DedD
MPHDERWGGLKIVAPKQPSREQELIGGLQNALSRGENMAKAKQSFISAGYKSEEIQAAAQKVSTTPSVVQQAPAPTAKQAQQPSRTQQAQAPQSQTTTTQPPQPKEAKQVSKKFIIILASIGALILIGSLVVGLFWNKVF